MKKINSIKYTYYILVCILYSQFCYANNMEEKGGIISGIVVTTDHQPAASVTVLLKIAGKNIHTITNENGVFTFNNLVAGNYDLEISLIGFQTIQQSIVVQPGKKLQLSFQLKVSEQQLQEIIVETVQKKFSAGKSTIPDKDLPLSTGIVSNKEITDQQAIRLGDIVKNVPGVSLVQTRFGVNETYGARGYIIGITGGAGGGSIFKNGLPYNIAGMPEAATLESVEIIKGSSAFLYGSSSGGLIINMISKKPRYDFGGSFSLIAGSNQQYKPVVDVYGPINQHLAYRVLGSYENDRSYRDQVQSFRKYVNPSLMYRFGDKSSLVISQEYLYASSTPDPGVGLLDSGRVLTRAIPRSRFQNVGWAYNHVLQHTSSASYQQVLNDRLTMNASASYQYTDVDSYGCGSLNTASAAGIIARPLSRAHSIEKDMAAQAYLEGKIKTGQTAHHFIAGADFTNVTTYTDAFNLYNANGTALKTYDTINLLNPAQYLQRTDIPAAVKATVTTAPSNRAGIYVQDLISINRQLKLFAGVRYSYQSTVQTTIDSMATGTRPASGTRGSTPTTDYRVFSPKAGLVYQPSTNASFYISYANSFTTNTGVDVYGNLLPASIIHQYEVGAKNSWLKGKLAANISLYRIINSNLAQQAAYLADGITPNTNTNIKSLSGETTSDGIEIGFNGNLSRNFYFVTGYAYNFIRFTHVSGTKGSNIAGEQLVNAPNSTANGTVFYTFRDHLLKGLKLGLTGFYTGTRLGGYNNTVGQTVLGSRLVPLSDFTTIDLSAGYSYQKLSLQCKLSNLLNELNYLIHDNYSITPIAPRQLYVTIRCQL